MTLPNYDATQNLIDLDANVGWTLFVFSMYRGLSKADWRLCSISDRKFSHSTWRNPSQAKLRLICFCYNIENAKNNLKPNVHVSRKLISHQICIILKFGDDFFVVVIRPVNCFWLQQRGWDQTAWYKLALVKSQNEVINITL